jgi:hypothetical protein
MLEISPLELVPAFSSDIHDYYVRCAAGPNALTVSMTAPPGEASALLAPTGSASSQGQAISLTVNPNQAIVASAISGTSTAEYWIRCLPATFPQLDLVPHAEAGKPTPGYYVLGSSGGAPGYAMVLDGQGVPVWYLEATASGVDDVDVVDGGFSYFLTWLSAPLNLQYLSPWSTASVAPSGTELDTHELRVLPNGHYLVFSYPITTTTATLDLTGLQKAESSDGGVTSKMFDCKIVEFEPKTGAVVWTWLATDHLDVKEDSIVPALAIQSGVEAIDPFHCNSIDVDPANGNLLVSSRNMSSVFYVDKTTGKIVWKMGGSAYTKDNATYIPVADPFEEQHDARLQPGWSESTGRGQVSVFDDDSSGSAPARGLVLDVRTGADGATPGATVAWQYKTKGRSGNRGSFRIYPDGSRVIGWGENATPHLVFTEVDAKGHDLLDFYFLGNRVSYRVVKVPLSTFDLAVMRSTAGRSN